MDDIKICPHCHWGILKEEWVNEQWMYKCGVCAYSELVVLEYILDALLERLEERVASSKAYLEERVKRGDNNLA